MFNELLKKTSAVVEMKEEVKLNFRELAEKAILVKELKKKKALTEQETKFIADVLAVEVSEEDRVKVEGEMKKIISGG